MSCERATLGADVLGSAPVNDDTIYRAVECLSQIERALLAQSDDQPLSPAYQSLKRAVDNFRLTLWACAAPATLNPSQLRMLHLHRHLRTLSLVSPREAGDIIDHQALNLAAIFHKEEEHDAAPFIDGHRERGIAEHR